jgi:hypothetical protein
MSETGAPEAVVGLAMPVTVTLLDEPAATALLKVRVNTEDAIETAEHIVQPRVAPEKPVSVMRSLPPLGMVTAGVRAIVMVTPVALLKAPGVLSVIAGWLAPRPPKTISGSVPADDVPI